MVVIQQCSRLELRSAIKALVSKRCKPHEIYRIMYDVNGEVCFSQKSLLMC